MASERTETEMAPLNDARIDQIWSDFRRAGTSQLIGMFHMCLVLAAVDKVGLSARLREGALTEADAGAGLDAGLARQVLDWLAIKGVVTRRGDSFQLTDWGSRLMSDASLATLGFYVDAYGPVTQRLSELLSGESDYGTDVVRNGEALARHSATLFGLFHSPTVLRALEQQGASRLLDLGCGAGGALIDIALRNPGVSGVGMDIVPEVVSLARERAAEAGVSDRLKFVVGDAFRPDSWPAECDDVDGILAIGVLHEHFRSGEQAVIDILDTFAAWTRERVKLVLIGEPELRYDDWENDADFHLAHVVTCQGMPRSREEWLRLFEKSKLRCRRVLFRPDAGQRLCFFDLVSR